MTKPMLKFKSSRLVVMAAVAAISLTACSSLFTAESRFDPVKLTSYEQTAQGSIVWSQSIGSSGDYGFAPIVVGEDVFAATPNGNVARLGLANGAVRWNTKVPTALSAGVGTDGQIVVVTTRDGRVVALDANNGNQLWETRTSTVSTTPPVVGANMVVVRNDDVQQFFERMQLNRIVVRREIANADLVLAKALGGLESARHVAECAALQAREELLDNRPGTWLVCPAIKQHAAACAAERLLEVQGRMRLRVVQRQQARTP